MKIYAFAQKEKNLLNNKFRYVIKDLYADDEKAYRRLIYEEGRVIATDDIPDIYAIFVIQ